MNDDDLKLKLQEIKSLEEQLNQKKAEVRVQGVMQAQALIDSLDIDVSELRFKSSGRTLRKAAGTVPVKYRGPNGETWSGRGRQPNWLTALVEAGHTLEEFLV
mgnify:CR=1 FL=1